MTTLKITRAREARRHMRALLERRMYLMHLARLTPLAPRETREFAALTWSLRLFRTLYDDAGTLKADLTYRLPQPGDGAAAPPSPSTSCSTSCSPATTFGSRPATGTRWCVGAPPATGRWTALRAYARGESPTGPERFVAEHGGMDVTFAPWPACGWGPSAGLVGALWEFESQRRRHGRWRSSGAGRGRRARQPREPGWSTRTCSRLCSSPKAGASWRSGGWATPLAETVHGSRLRQLLHRLRLHVDGDPNLAEPATALVGIPGSTSTATLPRAQVTVELWDPRRAYSVEVIEQWLATPAVPHRAQA